MSLPIVISNRLIKIFGNIAKAFCYIFHFFAPNKRFIIPAQSDAYSPTDKAQKIPRIIWQTNFTDKASLPVYLNYLFNRIMSRPYEYRYVSTEERLRYIEANMSEEISNAYKRLVNGASQADLWRLLVLYMEGGIYMDIDAHLVWPLSKIIKAEDEEVFLLNKKHYTNYFIASAPSNPILKEAIDIVIDNINNNRIEGGVYNMTGPGVMNQALENKIFNDRFYRYTCIQGSFTNEHFQYIDRPRTKWTYMKKTELLKDPSEI